LEKFLIRNFKKFGFFRLPCFDYLFENIFRYHQQKSMYATMNCFSVPNRIFFDFIFLEV